MAAPKKNTGEAGEAGKLGTEMTEGAKPDAALTAPAVEEPAPAAPVARNAEEEKYPRQDHIDLAMGMYGEPAMNVAGALTFLDADATEFTKAEVRGAIDKFYGHVPVVDGEER